MVSSALPHLQQCGVRWPLSVSQDPSVATLWCSFCSQQYCAVADQAMLVLTSCCSSKNKFRSLCELAGVKQTYGHGGMQRNVTYFCNVCFHGWYVTMVLKISVNGDYVYLRPCVHQFSDNFRLMREKITECHRLSLLLLMAHYSTDYSAAVDESTWALIIKLAEETSGGKRWPNTDWPSLVE